MAKTPHWALFGANERGFDPKDTRFQRKNKSKNISGCWDYVHLGYWRTKTDGPRGFSDYTVIFSRTHYTNYISYPGDCKAEPRDASHVLGLRRQHHSWSSIASPFLCRTQSLFLFSFWEEIHVGEGEGEYIHSLLRFISQFWVIIINTPLRMLFML